MKIDLRITFLVLMLIAVLFSGCSYIKIINPDYDQPNIGTPHDLVVAHTGCGNADGSSFRAQLNSLDVTSAFRYDRSNEKWTATRYNLPLGRNTLSVSADVSVSGWCVRDDTDSHTFTVVTDCPPESYCAYFYDNPLVANATINALDATTLDYFWEYIDQLEETEEITIAEPAASRACVEPASCPSIVLTDTELKRIHAAKCAHAVWLDKNRRVNWRLHDFNEEDLRGLFAKELLFDGRSNDSFFWIVDYSPSEAYSYAADNDLIGPSIISTVNLVLNDLRTTDTHNGFLHGVRGYDGDLVDTACTLYNALTVCLPRSTGCTRISRVGCQSMARITIGLLRSLNIPGEITSHAEWYEVNHSSAVWPALQRVMPHGDDIYGADLRMTPTEEFLVPFSFYESSANTAVCGTNKDCLSHRHRALLAARYPAQWVRDRCCNPAPYGDTSCAAYLRESYSAYLTADEMTAAITTFTSLCP
ncbi:MAG: hypothetical protein A2W27_01160 [Deltaproteobacteria bacterium RBG_16_44_11]|nr:MAG: hypothetical protein A2W27_01160 [Deltaproteobacteria bacterium RBG_16_44_11]